MRLIDADALPTLATELRLKNGKTKHFVGVEFDDIRNAPTIEAEPVRHGRWLFTDTNICECSVCHTCEPYPFSEFDWCPNCGARLDTDGK